MNKATSFVGALATVMSIESEVDTLADRVQKVMVEAYERGLSPDALATAKARLDELRSQAEGSPELLEVIQGGYNDLATAGPVDFP